MTTILWIVIDRYLKWEYNTRLKAILQTILRYHLGFTLILYGIAKVFPLQFGIPDMDTLATDFGDFDPMSLLWSFMSYSRFYTAVTGWVEVLAGLFLLFRKTTFLGVFLSFVAMVNVVVIDIGYDVTVKMFAIHLLLMATILLADHIKRIINFLLLNLAAEPFYYTNLFRGKEKLATVIKVLVITVFGYFTYSETKKLLENEAIILPNSFFSGYHTIEDMIINGDTILDSNPQKWKYLSIGGSKRSPDQLWVKTNRAYKQTYQFELDSSNRTLSFKDIQVENHRYDFIYEELNNKRFVFKGKHLSDSIVVVTKAKTLDDYLLIKIKRSWIRDLQ